MNWRMEVLQTSALPLGYAAMRFWSGKRDLNSRLQPWQGCTLPLSYSRSARKSIYTGLCQLSSDDFIFFKILFIKMLNRVVDESTERKTSFPLTSKLPQSKAFKDFLMSGNPWRRREFLAQSVWKCKSFFADFIFFLHLFGFFSL